MSWRDIYRSHLLDTLVVDTTFVGNLTQKVSKQLFEEVEKRGNMKKKIY